MVAHRKNVPPPQAFVPSSWFIVLTVMLVVGGAGWLGWLLVDDDSDSPVASPSASAPTASASPAPSPAPSESPDASPAPTDEPADGSPAPTDPTPSPAAVDRDAAVSVLNNSGVAGAARTFATKVTAAGWRLGGVGNWTGSIGANTVYYPPGLQSQAELLAADVGIDRIRPSVAPMRPDRLTIILSGQQ